MLTYQQVQEIVRDYQAKYELINAGVPEVMVAQQTRRLMWARCERLRSP